jgi:hypothetical protein
MDALPVGAICLPPHANGILSVMTSNDRREFQRLHLAKPILASLDDGSALVLDIGIGGALIEHYGLAVPGDQFKLLFRWQGEDVAFLCEVKRTRVVREQPAAETVTSHSGVRFVDAAGKSATLLTDMMATFVGKVLSAQRDNASGQGGGQSAATLAQLGGARRARTRGWLTYRYRHGVWSAALSRTAAQPPDGFTVAAHEDEDELQTLCDTYAAADEEGRRLIRLVAELSAKSSA